MSFTYDLGTNLGKVRLLIRDTDTTDPERQLFQDNEISFFLSQNDQILRLAAADALEALAANAALLAKIQQIGGYKIDSTKMAEAIRKQATRYRELEEEVPAFGYAEQTLSVFSSWEILINELQREG